MVAAEQRGIPVHVIKKNASSQIVKFLKFSFKGGAEESPEDIALNEVREAIQDVKDMKKPVDLAEQNSYIRRIQHQLVDEAGLKSESIGDEPKRKLRIFPV
jgi:hypothetical protein